MLPIYIDVKTDDDGDLTISSSGDLELADASRTLLQTTMFRIKTSYQDYEIQPMIGANIDSIIGYNNTRINGQKIVDLIIRSFTHDGFLSPSQFTVKPAPIGPSTIAIAIKFDIIPGVDTATVLLVTINYDTGDIEMIAGTDQQGSGSL